MSEKIIAGLSSLIKGEKWSKDVKTRWDAPEGLFTKGPEAIADGLAKGHKDLQSAMAALNFYINRAGKNLSNEDKARLEKAKAALRKKFQ